MCAGYEPHLRWRSFGRYVIDIVRRCDAEMVVTLAEGRSAEMADESEAAPAAEPPVFLSSLDANGERAVFWTRSLPGRPGRPPGGDKA